MGVKIRGIYSTAISKILHDNGIEVVNPSDLVRERMKIENKGKVDTLIYDKEDLDGIIIHGRESEKVLEVLKKELGTLFVKKLETGDIYRGIIKRVDMKDKEIIVDLGGREGLLSLRDYWGYLKEGQPVLVQVKGRNKDFFLLSSHLRLFGENMVLIKDGFTKPSKHIKDREEMERLLELSKEAKLKGWGILWKALAEGKSDEELLKEMRDLMEEEKKIKEEFEKGKEPELLKKGFCIYFVDFPLEVKERLDEIRAKVSPTIKGHHLLKSGGYMMLADFADKLVGEVKPEKLVEGIKQVFDQNVKEGNFFKIIRKKVGGEMTVWKGKIAEKGKSLKVVRRLRPGKYNDVDIDQGDYEIITLKEREEHVVHEYFNQKGELKARFYSVNTPVELFPRFARYIYLGVDVVEKEGKKEVIQRVQEIPEEVRGRAMKIAEGLVR